MLFQRPVSLLLIVAAITGSLGRTANACPFCSAVSQTLRQEMLAMDAVVIASAAQSGATRNAETGEIEMKIEKILKGDSLVSVGETVKAIYYGEVEIGRRFMLSGVDPPNMQWSCLPLSESAEAYVIKITQLPDDPLERLKFHYDYLQDPDSMLSRDAYDEFAITPYPVIQSMKSKMDHDKLVEWIKNPEMSTDRKRLYLTMLGVCGTEADVVMLEQMLRSTEKSTRGGLDALIACYLTLAGEKGLPLIDELFLNNHQAPYADTYSAIMAVRFHGTEGNVIPRSALVESLHHVLDRPDLADLVIPDLARWNDWTQIDRLTELFIKADSDNNWVRVPVVNYLRACPLPEAKTAIKKLEEVDPASVRRANTFFAIPVPAKEAAPSSSSIQRPKTKQLVDSNETRPRRSHLSLAQAAAPIVAAPLKSAQPSASNAPLSLAGSPIAEMVPMNPWRLASVLAMSLCTVMIVQFLLLTGGKQASQSPS
jgi:hypothetical protein